MATEPSGVPFANPKRTGAMDGPVRVKLKLCLKSRPHDVKGHRTYAHVIRHAVNPVELHPHRSIPPPVECEGRFIENAELG